MKNLERDNKEILKQLNDAKGAIENKLKEIRNLN
jgi:hypothetical protein